MDMFRELRKMQKEMDSLFDRVFNSGPQIPSRNSLAKQPETDVRETAQEITVTIDLPGVDKADIQLDVTADTVSVKAEKKHEMREEKEDYLHKERVYRSFIRAITLPAEVHPEQVEAEYKDGVLTIHLPKKEIAQTEKKRITVK